MSSVSSTSLLSEVVSQPFAERPGELLLQLDLRIRHNSLPTGNTLAKRSTTAAGCVPSSREAIKKTGICKFAAFKSSSSGKSAKAAPLTTAALAGSEASSSFVALASNLPRRSARISHAVVTQSNTRPRTAVGQR
eukprot:CAMPEP_0115328106 /NCGR_PEP_ID=MMETSP0270-20121206/84499_1 /TAXON_ID=71861 /ORGANISM="Scrippsiella trochoidea, Strain CCMP3099" /LENGTH=134 /DNA_ID=CAMNT_0002748597 /DNA_START=118 /DNA_END=523 /DNA_ORIENTATION=-